MKKLLLILLTICTVALFSACGGSGSQAEDQADDQTQAQQAEQTEEETQMDIKNATLLYLGHGCIRITTAEDKVIYIDPFIGDDEWYEPAADLILSTHDHYDHVVFDKIGNRNDDCQVITRKEALAGGEHQSFDFGYAQVEAVEAGYNKNHNVKECVGYIITLTGGVTVYLSGDTSTTEQMPSLAERNLDYAFFCCDGIYNMDTAEASDCAALVKAKHSIPYHMTDANSGVYFDRAVAEQFEADGRIILEQGEELELK